jgi:peroxiredoxin Q/BCP
MVSVSRVIEMVESGEIAAADVVLWTMREIVIGGARFDELPSSVKDAVKAQLDWYLEHPDWVVVSNSGVTVMWPMANEVCRKIGYRTDEMPTPSHDPDRDRIALISGKGVTRTLADYRHSWLVIYFYPKDNTPGCTLEGIDFNAHLDEFRAAGAEVIGVSRDSAKSHAGFCAKHGFRFDLLSDPDDALGNAFGVIGEKSLYGRKFIGVVRSTFLLDPEGRVAAEWRGVKVNGHAEAVLAELQRLQAGGEPAKPKAVAKKAATKKSVAKKKAATKAPVKKAAAAKKAAPAVKKKPAAKKPATKKAARRK